MDTIEKVARALAKVDDNDPDKPVAGPHRIVGQTIPVFRYDPELAAWNYYVPLAKLFVAAAAALADQ